jgi:hypothetical protein
MSEREPLGRCVGALGVDEHEPGLLEQRARRAERCLRWLIHAALLRFEFLFE